MYRKLPVFEELLTFSPLDHSLSRQDQPPLAPCLAFSGNATWTADDGQSRDATAATPSGCVVSHHIPALAAAGQPLDHARPLPSSVPDSDTVLDCLPHPVWTSDCSGIVIGGNRHWQRLAAAASNGGRAWTALLVAEEQEAALSAWYDRAARGEPYKAQHLLRTAAGKECWALVHIVPIRSPDNAISSWCGSFTDIGALKMRESQLELLTSELTHRIQNIFAVVESLLTLSARSQPGAADFASSACARVRALARANDYIRPQRSDQPLTMHGLLATLLEPYKTDGPAPASIEVSGADHAIGSASATMLALVMHELATNAAKYGSLSKAGGRISVTTSCNAERYRINWTEIGGPIVPAAPATRGFGTLLTDRALRHPLGAVVERQWTPAGLILDISMASDHLAH